jgi:hypothetical protein
MKERDILDAIMNTGVNRGVLTFNEISDALLPELFLLGEIEDFMDLLLDMGVKIIDYEDRVN